MKNVKSKRRSRSKGRKCHSKRLDIVLEPLAKQQGGRLDHISTFRALCEKGKGVDTNAWVIPMESLKAADESDVFVHVLKAVFRDEQNEPVVVKLQSARGPAVPKENLIYARTEGHRHVVRRICAFDCLDTESRWLQRLPAGTLPAGGICSGGPDRLHVAIYEYIDHDLLEQLARLSEEEVVSIVRQLAMGLVELATKYGISHGDIGSGNLRLERDTTEAVVTYTLSENQSVSIPTTGWRPVLIDFQRGWVKAPSEDFDVELVRDEPATLLYVASRWVHNAPLRERLLTASERVAEASDLVTLVQVLLGF